MAIVVDVATAAKAATEGISCDVAVKDMIGICHTVDACWAKDAAKEQIGFAPCWRVIIVVMGTNDKIGKAIAIDIAHACKLVAGLISCVFTQEGVVGICY